MKVLILCFSGTGNTYFIADRIKNILSSKNYEVALNSVESFQPEDTEKFDVVILGFPIYACDMPRFLQHYISDLTAPQTKNIILFSTMGFYGANTSSKVSKRLMKIGMVPLLFQEIKMPGSDGLVFMKKDSRYIRKVLSTNFLESKEINSAVDNIVQAIDNLNGQNIDKESTKNISSTKLSGIIAGGLMNLIYGFVERFLKKNFWADEKCMKCHYCENICPSHNILIENEKVVFSDRCYLCMRCINQCPTEAIQIGKNTKGKFRWKGPLGNYRPKKI